MFSMVISVISEVISVDFGDFGESCYPYLLLTVTFLVFMLQVPVVWGQFTDRENITFHGILVYVKLLKNPQDFS